MSLPITLPSNCLSLPRKKQFLKPGGKFFGRDCRVETVLGSCVSITAWFDDSKLGGACHFMLPHRSGSVRGNNLGLDGRYGDEAWAWMLEQFKQYGLRAGDGEFKVFGGANVLGHSEKSATGGIGRRNLEAAFGFLEERGLACKAADVSGSADRYLKLDLVTGNVWVRKGHLPAKAGGTSK